MLKTFFKVLMLLLLTLPAIDGHAQTEMEQAQKAEKEKKKKPPEISTKVYNNVAPSVVKIECDGGNKIGSGTIVALNENGRAIILTACHVVAIDFENTPADSPLRFYDDIVVRLATDTLTVRKCEVLSFQHREKDLVLIATREPVPEKNIVIKYNRSHHSGPGSLVAAMGFPDADKMSQTVGNIKRWEGGFFVFDATIAPGSSGGPLIDKHGRMVGLSSLTFEGEGYAVPFDSLSTVVDGWLNSVILKQFWRYQKYANLGQKMINDWRFLATEFAVAGVAGYAIAKALEPDDLPLPPPPPVDGQ